MDPSLSPSAAWGQAAPPLWHEYGLGARARSYGMTRTTPNTRSFGFSPPIFCHLSLVTYHLATVRRHLSPVSCPLFPVARHLSPVCWPRHHGVPTPPGGREEDVLESWMRAAERAHAQIFCQQRPKQRFAEFVVAVGG